MSAPQDLHPTSAEFDSDSDLSFEVTSESLPNVDIISESDNSDSEEQNAPGAVLVEEVETMCSGLEPRINALPMQLEESNMPMETGEEITKEQENQLANLMAENEALKQTYEQLKITVSRRNLQIAEVEKETAEVSRNLDLVMKQWDAAFGGLKKADEIRFESGELQTRYQQMAKTSMKVGSKLADKLDHLEVRNKELEEKLAEREEEKKENLAKIENLTSEKNEFMERLKNAEEMRISKVNKLQTMYQGLTEQGKQVKEKLNDNLVDYFFETHGLKHSLASRESESEILKSDSEKNMRKISNLKNDRNELREKLYHQECVSMKEMSKKVMVLTADLNEMQAEHQRVTLENMELNQQKATLEQETQRNLVVIQELKDRSDKLEMANQSLKKEIHFVGSLLYKKSNACAKLQNGIKSLKKSKADCEAKFQALDHRNVQLESQIAERDEEKRGDMEEIQNLRKFKNALLEEMKAKECHANGQIEELTRINMDLEEQICAGDEVADNLIEELAEREKMDEQKHQALADEKELFVEKYKKYKQIAHGYKKKCQELSEQSQLNRSIGNRADFEKQINGSWVLTSSRKSNGFSLPEKYHNWNKGQLVCELKGNRFTTSIHNGLIPTNMKHFVLETIACFMTNEALFTVDYKTAPFGMVARHYFENGMLKIKVMVNNETGVYTFTKAE